MTSPGGSWFEGKRLGIVAPIILAIAVAIAYFNVPGNAFALDDWHTIEQNPWIRSLGNIPRFFVDSTTNSTVRENMDYRPVLQASLAINYAMSGASTSGLDSWHLTNLAIHLANAWCAFILGRRLIGSKAATPLPGVSGNAGDIAALAAAMIFAIHPVSAAAVNYISARSTSLTSLWVLLAIIHYLGALAEDRGMWRLTLAWICSVLAVLTKIEGVTAFGAIIFAEFLLNPATRSMPVYKRLLVRASWLRLAPFAIATGLLIILWKSRTGILNIARSGADVTPLDYLMTQFRAWWYYVGKIVLPTNLIADYPTYPRSKFSDVIALRDWRPLAALAGWLIVIAGGLACIRRVPAATFAILCFFAFFMPHSSIVPLAEPVNEHRAYLPNIVVLLLLSGGATALLEALIRRPRLVTACLALAAAIPLLALTHQRNRTWKTPLSLWADTVAKVPDSPRANANYASALDTAGRLDEAERFYKKAIHLAPGLHYAHTNLAQLLLRRGDAAGAQAALDTAVRAAPDKDGPYYARGYFRAQIRDIPGAAADLQRSVELASSPFKEIAAAAEALIRLGRTSEAQPYLARGRAINPTAFEAERNSFRAMMGAANPMEQIADGMAWLQQQQPIPAEGCFREALRLDPGNITAKVCLGLLLQSQGKVAEARAWFDRVAAEHPGHPDPLHFRGRLLASLGEFESALRDFRNARAMSQSALRETAAIIETLELLGRTEDAQAEVSKVDPFNASGLEQERTSFRDAIRRR